MSHLVPACLSSSSSFLLPSFALSHLSLHVCAVISHLGERSKTGFLISQSEQLFIPPLLNGRLPGKSRRADPGGKTKNPNISRPATCQLNGKEKFDHLH
jgi:hypothetical protein